MPERRDLAAENPALKEDRGIFKSGVVDVAVELTPLWRTTGRGDALCIGFIEDVEIEIIFPGRRTSDIGPLRAHMETRVREANLASVKAKRPPPPPTFIREKLKAQGTWRVRTFDGDVPERRYQFLAARWSFRDRSGERSFGKLPER